MKILLAFALLAVFIPPAQTKQPDHARLEVVQLSFEKKLIEREELSRSMVSNQPPVIKPDPSANRGPDPNEQEIQKIWKDTSDRMRDLDSVQNLKKPVLPTPKVWVYGFQAKMKNTSAKPITKFVWAYQLPESSPNVPDSAEQEYLCNVRIELGQTRQVKVISPIPRSKVVAASGAATPPALHEPTLKDMIIKQIQFADNDRWQLPNWNPVVLTRQRARKLGKGKCIAL